VKRHAGNVKLPDGWVRERMARGSRRNKFDAQDGAKARGKTFTARGVFARPLEIRVGSRARVGHALS
jgi:hypothetical protein